MIYKREIIRAIEPIKLFIYYSTFPSALDECRKSAINIGDGQVFGVCVRESIDNGSSETVDSAIIYDTSSQLLLPESKRSPLWLKAAERFGARREAIHESELPGVRGNGTIVYKPIKLRMMDMFDDVAPLGGGFFHVRGIGTGG